MICNTRNNYQGFFFLKGGGVQGISIIIFYVVLEATRSILRCLVNFQTLLDSMLQHATFSPGHCQKNPVLNDYYDCTKFWVTYDSSICTMSTVVIDSKWCGKRAIIQWSAVQSTLRNVNPNPSCTWTKHCSCTQCCSTCNNNTQLRAMMYMVSWYYSNLTETFVLPK